MMTVVFVMMRACVVPVTRARRAGRRTECRRTEQQGGSQDK